MSYQNIINALLVAVPELPAQALPTSPPENVEYLTYDWLFPKLGYDEDFQVSPHGQFMTYVEWKEPEIDLNQFKAVQQLGISFDANEILAPVYAKYEESLDEDELEDLADWYSDLDNELLNAYNQALEPHNLQLIDINTGLSDNSFLLLVHNDENKINQLRQAFEDLGLTPYF